ncbi:hypothetical protein C8J57DRAFT_158432 [Mycena rebaudengoi]|nr:hypothetical protein C8J57DRAFT_158432 [Mycena rebaudengoi]
MGPCMAEARRYLIYMLPSALRNSCPDLALDFKDDEPKEQDDYNTARHHIVVCAKQTVCMRVDCDVRVTRLCKRCWVVGYCSESCLELAWRSDIAPHKQTCNLIVSLRTQVEALEWHSPNGAPALKCEEWMSLASVYVFHAGEISSRLCRALWLNLSFLKRANKIGLVCSAEEFSKFSAADFATIVRQVDYHDSTDESSS